jgi:hypothetical protein
MWPLRRLREEQDPHTATWSLRLWLQCGLRSHTTLSPSGTEIDAKARSMTIDSAWRRLPDKHDRIPRRERRWSRHQPEREKQRPRFGTPLSSPVRSGDHEQLFVDTRHASARPHRRERIGAVQTPRYEPRCRCANCTEKKRQRTPPLNSCPPPAIIVTPCPCPIFRATSLLIVTADVAFSAASCVLADTWYAVLRAVRCRRARDYFMRTQ